MAKVEQLHGMIEARVQKQRLALPTSTAWIFDHVFVSAVWIPFHELPELVMPRNENRMAQKVRDAWQKRLTGRLDLEGRRNEIFKVDKIEDAPDSLDNSISEMEMESSHVTSDLSSVLTQWEQEFEVAITFLIDEVKRIFSSSAPTLPHDLDSLVLDAIAAKVAVLRQLHATSVRRIRAQVAEDIRIAVERDSYPDTLEFVEKIHKQELEHARLAGQAPPRTNALLSPHPLPLLAIPPRSNLSRSRLRDARSADRNQGP